MAYPQGFAEFNIPDTIVPGTYPNPKTINLCEGYWVLNWDYEVKPALRTDCRKCLVGVYLSFPIFKLNSVWSN